MRILALDYSTHAGWAYFEEGKLVEYGTLHCDTMVKDEGTYPWSYVSVAHRQADLTLIQLIWSRDQTPDVVVIEETNGSKNRYTQKLLEFLHLALLDRFATIGVKVVYVNTGDWRKNLGIWLTKEQKKANAKLSKAKSAAKKAGVKLDKGALGIRGKITKKHAAVHYVNERFGYKLKIKDNDAAEAICIGLAFLNNVPHCNGE